MEQAFPAVVESCLFHTFQAQFLWTTWLEDHTVLEFFPSGDIFSDACHVMRLQERKKAFIDDSVLKLVRSLAESNLHTSFLCLASAGEKSDITHYPSVRGISNAIFL